MNKLSLRENSGDWIYYLTSFKYFEVEKYVKRIDRELHSSKTLSDMIQRSLTDNVDKIANYIINQKEHFFNALVLAVYDGDPQWREVQLDYGDEETYELGILEFSGEEKIFPVDGQHRVEGIKKVLEGENREAYLNETIPVILIGHKNTPEGMKRTRRLFSTLNRYAKPVSLNDIIALDEDDIIAIATRHLIETHPLFQEARLNNHKQKAIPEKDKTAFTNIISLYECNTVLLNHYIRDIKVENGNGKGLKGKSKIDAYCRFRRSDEEIDGFLSFVDAFWNACADNITSISEYLKSDIHSNPAAPFRNKEGGDLLFRPVGQRPFVLTAIALYEKLGDFNNVAKKLNKINYSLQSDLWTDIAWNPISMKMITSSNGKLIEYIMKYLVDSSLLDDKQRADMVTAFRAFKKDEELDVLECLEQYRIKEGQLE